MANTVVASRHVAIIGLAAYRFRGLWPFASQSAHVPTLRGATILPTAFWYRHDVHPAQEIRGIPEPTVLLGPLCMAIDVLREMMLPPVKAGDQVVINRVGAYNMTQWMQFIMSRPNVVLLSPQGEQAIIRRAESLETLTAQEQVPQWLRAS